MIKPLLTLLLGVAVAAFAPQGANAEGERAVNHQIEAHVVGGGGSQGYSTMYLHMGTLGQPHPVGMGYATQNVLCSGFWRAQFSLLTSPVPDFARLSYKLWQNSPNPFNPMTTIRFRIAESARVQLVVFDVRGQRVRTLVDAPLAAGLYSEIWDGCDDGGGKSASGVYFYRLVHGDSQQTEKMLLVK